MKKAELMVGSYNIFNMIFLFFFLGINILSYLLMWIDKIKSLYGLWRISEKTLWIFALFWGVFGIYLWMQAPLYHKAGKPNFRFYIPLIMLFWFLIVLFVLQKL